MRETLTIYVHAHKKLEKMLQLTYDINIYQICDNVIWSCAWRPNKNEVALCGSDKIIYLCLLCEDTKKISNIIEFEKIHTKTIRSVAWSPCGEYIAAASFDSTVSVYSVDKDHTIECISVVEGHENEVKCVAWDSSGTFLATCGRDCSVWVWEFLPPNEFQCISVSNHHTQDVKKVAFHPFTKQLVSCGYDSKINFYDMDEDSEWILTDSFSHENCTVWSCSFSACGRYLAACTSNQLISIYLMEGIKKYEDIIQSDSSLCMNASVCQIKGSQTLDIYDISWSPNGNYISTCSRDNSVCIYKIEFGQHIHLSLLTTMNDVDCDINAISWKNSTDKILACVTDSGTLLIYHIT